MQHSAAAGDAPADMKKKPSIYDKLQHRKINTSFIKKLSAQEISDLSLELQERCVNFSGQSEDYLQLKNIIAEVLAELPNKLTNENGLQTHKTDLQNYFLVLVTRQRRKEREVTEEPRPIVIDAYTTIANIGKRILYQNKNMRFQPPRSVDEVQMITKLMEKNVADLHALKVSDSDEDSLSYREDYLVLCTDALEHLSREMERIRRDSSDKRDTPSPREHCAGNAQHSVMPAVNAQRPVMPAVNAQHPFMPAVNAQPPLMPKVNSPVMPAVIAQSPVMPASVNYAQPPVMLHAPNNYYYQQPSPFYPPYPRLYQHNAMQFHMMQRQLAVQAQLAAQAQFAAQQAHATYLHYHQNLQAMMHFGGNNVGNEPIVQIAEVESPMEEKKEINLTPQHQEKGSVGNERSENVQVVVESPMEEKKESNPEHGEDSVGNETKSESVLQIDEIETPVEEKKESNTADNADHNLQDSPDVCSTFETPVSLESESTETNPLPEKSELLPTGEVVEAEIENDLKTLVCEMEQKTMGFWGPLENLPALQDAIEKLKTKVLCDKACGPVEAASLVEKLEHFQQLLMNRVAMMESALDTDSDDEDFYSVNSKDSVDKVCHVTPEGSSDAGDDVLTQEIVEPVEKNAAPTKQEEDCDKIVRNSEEVCVDESLDLLADNLDGPDNQEPQNKHGSLTKQPEEEDCSEIVQDSVLDSEKVCVDESLDLLAVDNLDGPGNQEAQNVQKSSDDIQRMANIHQMGQWFSDAFVPPHFVWLPQFFGSPQMCVADPSWPGQPQVQTDGASSGFHTMPASPPALTIQLGSTCNTITGLQGAANIQAHHGPISSHRGLPATNTMNPSQPMSVTQQAVHKPLTASMLVDLPLGKQKQMFGERLFPLLQQMYPELAAKITGMLLELDNSELLHLLEHHESLRAKVEEAVAMLQAHQAEQ